METKYFVSAADKPYDLERDGSLRAALELVHRRRDSLEFLEGPFSTGYHQALRVSDYLYAQLRDVFGGVS